MESRLPKLREMKKAKSTLNILKPTVESNGLQACDSAKATDFKKSSSSFVASKTATDENKSFAKPKFLSRAKTETTITRDKPAPVLTKVAAKRSGPINKEVDPKKPRNNLKTVMKAAPIRINRPTAASAGVTKAASAVQTAASKPAGPKPSKWDYKGRLEYASNELTTLKQKHREVTAQYKSVQDEIQSLRESDNTYKDKIENLESTAAELSNQVLLLTDKLKTVREEKKSLIKELNVTKESLEVTSASLKECQDSCETKSTLISEQTTKLKTLKRKLKAQESVNKEQTLTIDELQALVLSLDRDRRVLHNTIQEMKGNIRVFCRVRPKIEREASKGMCSINYVDECTIDIGKADNDSSCNGKLRSTRQEFTFDKVFPPTSRQEDVFEELSMLVQSALEGYNVCVFAYGQTGSGKTYTMEGIPGEDTDGMIPRTVKHIFKEMKHFQLLGWEYKIEASFLEIYNEQIVDLLDTQKKSHEIRMADSKGHDLFVSNLRVEEISSPEELHECLLTAQRNRAVAATQANERSSRSHSVARIRLIGEHAGKQEVSIGNLNLVDLAGSERLKNEEATRTAETKNINKSLANLGHVILALLQKQDHIPYRNSKLTHLLMPSLGGNSKTLMLLNISPLEESYNETLNSLRFGSNVNSCKTGNVKRVRTVL